MNLLITVVVLVICVAGTLIARARGLKLNFDQRDGYFLTVALALLIIIPEPCPCLRAIRAMHDSPAAAVSSSR